MATILKAILVALLEFIWGKRDEDNEAVEMVDDGGGALDDCERL